MLLNINATRAFILCFFTILNQKEFRIATVAMFTCDLYAGVVPQMSPPPHELERLRTTMVDWFYALTYINYWTKLSSNEPGADVQGAAVTCYIPTGRCHDPDML